MPQVPRSAAVPAAWAAVAQRPRRRTSGAGRVAAVPEPRGIESRPGGEARLGSSCDFWIDPIDPVIFWGIFR